MQNKTYRWGILGTGQIASAFAQDLQLVNNAKLHAVVSRELTRAQDFATTYGASKSYDALGHMLNEQEIDILYIATPHSLHAHQSIQSLTAGIPVLCEKPAVLNLHQMKEVLHCASKHETFYMEALWTRFLPATEMLLEIIESGEMGEVHQVEAEFCATAPIDPLSRLYDLSLGGGSILDIGIYPVFLSYLLLRMPSSIEASGQLAATGVDQTCSMTFKYPEKGKESALHSSILYDSNMPARITMSKGYILLQAPWYASPGLTIIKAGEDSRSIACPPKGIGLYHEILECHRCLSNRHVFSEKWNHQDNANMLELLDEIRRQVGVQYLHDLAPK
ncbi:MAG: Gfo/Idh/MocA family oxidoreductase [Saprospiraceae bacterium]|nr:Gfo/Idh/MocA family oxidoreductase [Saprospiraceae bacterium]